MNYPKDNYVITSFISEFTTATCSSTELTLWEEFYERTRIKERVKEVKIKRSLRRFNRHEQLNNNTGENVDETF